MTDSAIDGAASRLKNVYAALEPLTKSSVAGVALSYALGLLIKNIYLARWETFSASLVEVEYVLSGGLFVLVVLVGITYWSSTIGIVRRARRDRNREIYERSYAKARSRIKIIVAVVGGGAGLAMFLAFIYRDAAWTLRYVEGLATTVFIFPPLWLLSWQPVKEMWNDFTLGRKIVPGEVAMRIFVRVVLLLAILIIYVDVMYPNIPPVYGGGKHTKVQLLVNADGANVLRGVGLRPTAANLYDAELIFEDSTYLTLAAPLSGSSRRAVRLRRDQVNSILTRGVAPLADWF